LASMMIAAVSGPISLTSPVALRAKSFFSDNFHQEYVGWLMCI
jgi:hypothetical protein